MPSLGLGIRVTATYCAFIAAAMFYIFHLAPPPASTVEVLAALFPFQLLAALYCVAVALRHFGWRGAGFGTLRWRGLVWLVPGWLVLAAMVWNIAAVASPRDFLGLGTGPLMYLILTPLLIAFSEEVVFRGILLRGAMATVPILPAMLTSAVLFGAMHLITALSGQGMAGTTQQVVFAILVGFFLAPIAVKLGNLWPLVIWHWLWNIAVFASQMADVWHPFVVLGIAMQGVVCVWLWTELLRGKVGG